MTSSRYADAADGKKTGARTSVGFFIPLPAEQAEKFPPLGDNDKSAPHITFLYVGSVAAEDEQKLLDTASRVFSEADVVQAHQEPVEYFIHPAKERRVAVVPYRFSRDLSGIRWKLRDALIDAGFEVDDKFPLIYRPHTTLAYLDGLETKYEGEVPTGDWEFDSIEVWGLPKVHKVKFGETTEARVASKYVEGMTDRASKALMQFLSGVARKLGVGEHIYVVGGAVRNFVLKEPIKDIDIVVDSVALGGKDSDWFAKQLREEIPTETSHVTNNYGVAILTIKGDWEVGGVNLKGEDIEIANARSESYADGGYKPTDVAPATIHEDIYRREFTFNTLLWRLMDLADGPDKAEIIDLTGCGLKDLSEGVAKCPRDPDIVFNDDASRMVRAIKFLLKYGLKISPDVEASIRRNKQKLWNIPPSHLSNMLIEVFFEAGIGKKALLEMKRLGLLEVVHDIAQKDKAFRLALSHWADRRADLEFLFDLMDLGMPTGRRLSGFSPQEKARIRELTVQMTPADADAFVGLLEQPGKVLNMPGLIEEYGFKGPDIRRISDAAKATLLADPTLANSPTRWTDLVKAQLNGGRVAKTYTFNEGDPVYFGKFKNKPGKIKDFKKDEKSGDPIVVIEPDPKGQKDDKEVKLLKIRERTPKEAGLTKGYHVSPATKTPLIKQQGLLPRRGEKGVYVWDSLDMARWFRAREPEAGHMVIWEVNLQGIPLIPDPETEDMHEWSSGFKPGQNGGGFISREPISRDRIRKLEAASMVARRFMFADDDTIQVIDFVRGYKQITGVRRIPVARNVDPRTKQEQIIIGNDEIDQLGIRIPGKEYLTDDEMNRLFNGEVVIEEKVDGHPVIVLHGGYTFFCESLRIQHTVGYDDVPYSQMGWPDMTVVYEIMEGENAPPYRYGEGTGKWLSRSEKESLCQMVGAPLVPLVYKGHLTPEKLPALADRLSSFGSGKAEGVVIKNLSKGVFGKFINLEFQKAISDDSLHGGVHPELKGIRNLRKYAAGTGRLRVFDFDDTLVSSKGFISVVHQGGGRVQMNSATFAHYTAVHGDSLDFGAFNDIIEPRIIKANFDTFKRFVEEAGTRVVILTARPKGSASAVQRFLEAQEITGVEVVALASSDPYDKAKWIDRAIDDPGADDVEFFDDSSANASAVEEHGKKHSGIKFQSHNTPHPKEEDYAGDVIRQTFKSADPTKAKVHIEKPGKADESSKPRSKSDWWDEQTDPFQKKYCEEHARSNYCHTAASDSNAAAKKAIQSRTRQGANKKVQGFILGFLEKIDQAGPAAGIWLETLESDWSTFTRGSGQDTKGFEKQDFALLKWVLFGGSRPSGKQGKLNTKYEQLRVEDRDGNELGTFVVPKASIPYILDEEVMQERVASRWVGRTASRDEMPGGLADKKKPSDFNQTQLEKGIKVESEHTSDKQIAREITMDHLTEDPDYYVKLEKVGKDASYRVAARYQEKKKIKTKDGDDAIVYVYSERQVQNRNREKAERVEKLSGNMEKLRTQVKKDLEAGKSEKSKTWWAALAVLLIDCSYERVGNPTSADDGHYGVTGWKVKHVTFGKGSATVKYVGKSGVKQEKTLDDPVCVKMLREAVKGKKPNDEVVDCASEDVNEYLKPMDITAKDIRGLHANREMQERLAAIRSKGGKLPEDTKEKAKKLKEEFKEALEGTAEAVGHEPATLKSQYLVPGLEDAFLKDGTVMKKLDKKGTRRDNGDCFEAAGKYFMNIAGKKSARLVHGEVMGQGRLEGVHFAHAWVEQGALVVDKSNGRDAHLPKSFYYALGHIDEIGNVYRYTFAQFQQKVLKFGHWGPWDLKTSTGF